MWQDRSKSQVSGVGVALFVISVAAGLALTTALGNRAPLVWCSARICCSQSRWRINGKR